MKWNLCQADVTHLAAKIKDGVKRGLVIRYARL